MKEQAWRCNHWDILYINPRPSCYSNGKCIHTDSDCDIAEIAIIPVEDVEKIREHLQWLKDNPTGLLLPSDVIKLLYLLKDGE